MKTLITGAAGQLGQELQLSIQNMRKTCGMHPLLDAEVFATTSAELDITDLPLLMRRVRQLQPDAIINCAAYTDVDGCETNKRQAFLVNSLGARNIAMAAEQCQTKLLHISTDYVFSGLSDKPYNEWDLCAPQSVYGHTKYLGEQYVREFCTRYYIIRTAWLYGKWGKNFVKTILRKAAENPMLTVVNDQFGSPTNAEDLAGHILSILATESYGIYHCTGKGVCSWYDFARKIIELSGISCVIRPVSSAEYPQKAIRPAYSVLENNMLDCTVGNNMRHWEDALRAFVEQNSKDSFQN